MVFISIRTIIKSELVSHVSWKNDKLEENDFDLVNYPNYVSLLVGLRLTSVIEGQTVRISNRASKVQKLGGK